MKVIKGIVSCIVHILLLLIAVDAIWMLSRGLDYHPLGTMIQASLPEQIRPETRGQYIYYWSGLVLLVVIATITKYYEWKSRRQGGIRVKTVDGETMVFSPASLNTFAKVQVENHPSVISHNIKVKQTGSKGLCVMGAVTVQSTRSMPEIKYELSTLIRQGFEKVMGIKKIDEIDLMVEPNKKDLRRLTAAGATETAPRKAIEAPMKSEVPAEKTPDEAPENPEETGPEMAPIVPATESPATDDAADSSEQASADPPEYEEYLAAAAQSEEDDTEIPSVQEVTDDNPTPEPENPEDPNKKDTF